VSIQALPLTALLMIEPLTPARRATSLTPCLSVTVPSLTASSRATSATGSEQRSFGQFLLIHGVQV
jgi:hypothetical protein